MGAGTEAVALAKLSLPFCCTPRCLPFDAVALGGFSSLEVVLVVVVDAFAFTASLGLTSALSLLPPDGGAFFSVLASVVVMAVEAAEAVAVAVAVDFFLFLLRRGGNGASVTTGDSSEFSGICRLRDEVAAGGGGKSDKELEEDAVFSEVEGVFLVFPVAGFLVFDLAALPVA